MSNFPLGDGIETPEATVALEQIRDRLGFPDTGGRLRVVVDAITGALTLATLATLTNQAQVGGLLANGDQVAQWNNIAGWNRSYIDVQP